MQSGMFRHAAARWAMFVLAAVACAALVGCTTTSPGEKGSSAERSKEIDAGVDSTLSRLRESSPDSRQLIERAAGVLVFPAVLSVSFGVGAEHGDGALRVSRKTVGYYSTSSGSIGFQAGAQSKAIVLLFMTPDSLAQFRKSDGWTAGADATVAMASVGANGRIDTNTMQQPVVGFVMSNAGLMAGVSLQGTKISKITL